MGDVKGYVVRGTWKARTLAGVEHPDRMVYAYWWDLMQDIQWCSEPDKIPFDGRLYFATVGEADGARCKSSHLSDVSIFRVFDDGREERLPPYQEALDHLAAVHEALAITPGETATGAARRVAAGLAQALAEIERLRAERGERTRDVLARTTQAFKDREALGRIVREVWIEWAREQPNPKASWLVPWEGLSEPDKEVDRRIGVRLASIMPDRLGPLTALEAAEQRLLASEGWTYVGLYGGEQWQHAKHGREGRMTALSIARYLAAKKGGS